MALAYGPRHIRDTVDLSVPQAVSLVCGCAVDPSCYPRRPRRLGLSCLQFLSVLRALSSGAENEALPRTPCQCYTSVRALRNITNFDGAVPLLSSDKDRKMFFFCVQEFLFMHYLYSYSF